MTAEDLGDAGRVVAPTGLALAPAAAGGRTDLELLRAYEPVVRYTQGELFFPAAVESYIPECDLFVGRSERERRLLVPYGELTEERLVAYVAEPGETLSMRLAQKPLGGLDLARWNRRPDRPVFHAPSRLARVGIFARLVDTAFTASLLLRGTVPGGTTAAAHVKYETVRATDPRFVYHGRILRSEGWIVLHYMYFYFMNDWRSTFAGANDHESDLEQAFVFLEDAPDGPRPVWFACAAHDYSGDQLRRRWDDPYLVKVGDHPVIHAGAGSHAAYFEAGEYMTAAPVPGARRLHGFLDALRGFWRDTLRQPDPGDLATSLDRALSIPFIDYARGDGVQVGGEGGAEWTPILIDDDVPWVDGYRGLLGLDTFDRFAGERAPAGPKYTRSGTVRQSWNDPIGWAGLAKAAPPFRMPAALESRLAELEAELATLHAENDAKAASLDGLDLEVRALSTDQSFAAIHQTRAAELAQREAEVNRGRSQEAVLADSIRAGRRELTRLRAGDLGDPRAHLHGDHHPVPPELTRYGRVIEVWSAISISLVLVGAIALIWFTPVPWYVAFVLAVAVYALLESAFRRRLTVLLLRITLILAGVGALILLYQFTTLIVFAAIVGLAGLTLFDNVREIRRS